MPLHSRLTTLALATLVGCSSDASPAINRELPAIDSLLPAEAPTTELDGNWQQVEMILDGRKLGDKTAKQLAYRFDAGRYDIFDEGRTLATGKYSVDSAKKPREVTMTESGGVTILGVYSLVGDELTICSHEETDRPTDFASSVGQRRLLVRLIRQQQ